MREVCVCAGEDIWVIRTGGARERTYVSQAERERWSEEGVDNIHPDQIDILRYYFLSSYDL